MADRYWIGNGGSWSDTAHWSASSGGVGGASVPDGTLDVAFDANSFNSPAQVVSYANITCKALNFTGVTNNPTLSGTGMITLWGDFTGGGATITSTGVTGILTLGALEYTFTQNNAVLDLTIQFSG